MRYGNQKEEMIAFPFQKRFSVRVRLLMTTLAILLLMLGSLHAFAFVTVIIGEPKIIQPHVFNFEKLDRDIVLYVISSVNREQICRDKKTDETWKCGEEAMKTVESLVDNADVTCILKRTDVFPAGMYVCKNWEGNDIGLEMLRKGLAFVSTMNGPPEEYIQAEEEARQHELGIWRSTLGDRILSYRQRHRVITRSIWENDEQ